MEAGERYGFFARRTRYDLFSFACADTLKKPMIYTRFPYFSAMKQTHFS